MYFKVCVFAILATVCLAEINEAELKAAIGTCSTEHGIDGTVFEKIQKGEPFDMTILAKKEFKCFVLCVNVKLGLSNDKGEPIVEGVKKFFGISDADVAEYNSCMTENKDTDPCVKAFNIEMCIIKKIKSM